MLLMLSPRPAWRVCEAPNGWVGERLPFDEEPISIHDAPMPGSNPHAHGEQNYETKDSQRAVLLRGERAPRHRQAEIEGTSTTKQ